MKEKTRIYFIRVYKFIYEIRAVKLLKYNNNMSNCKILIFLEITYPYVRLLMCTILL